MKKVQAYKLFWKGLGDLKGGSNYDRIRLKIAEFLAKKVHADGPASGHDKKMTGPDFKNVWHVHLSRQPDLVLFYEQRNEAIALLMLGSHKDYAHGSGNDKRQKRTVQRIENAREYGAMSAPEWAKPNWKTFDELLNDPDLPAVSKEDLIALEAEIAIENSTAERHTASGNPPDLDTEEGLDAFLDKGEEALQRVRALYKRRITPRDILVDSVESSAPTP